MSDRPESSPEQRVLVLAPTGADAQVSRAILTEAGIACHICRDVADLCHEFPIGVGAVLLTEESLGASSSACLVQMVQEQPPWSDVPIVLLTAQGTDSPPARTALDLLGNVTILERPVRVITLISTLRAALKARDRQYQLRDQTEALREADRRKDQFLATLAHELRNPLAPIRTAVEILKLKGPPDPALQRSRNVIDRQVRYMARLLEDLLDVSRITRDKLELRRERVELAAVIDMAVETSRPLIESREHRLTVTLPPERLALDADPVRLAQVFANLLNNAARYTERGGQIRLTAERQQDEVVVSVTDNGIGIDGDMLPRVFDLFSQAAPTLHRSQSGLGIGLSLVKGLVEMHGGQVEAHSEGPNRGSEFTVRLPLAAAAPAPEPDAPEVDGDLETAAERRILVVDDIRENADTMAALLEELGYDVRTAYGGEEAVEVTADFRPSVIILDIGMPDIDGYEVARRIRGQPWGAAIHLIALTGWAGSDDRRRSREAGIDTHLAKPVDYTALLQLLA